MPQYDGFRDERRIALERLAETDSYAAETLRNEQGLPVSSAFYRDDPDIRMLGINLEAAIDREVAYV